jgi:hypothetical protein
VGLNTGLIDAHKGKTTFLEAIQDLGKGTAGGFYAGKKLSESHLSRFSL